MTGAVSQSSSIRTQRANVHSAVIMGHYNERLFPSSAVERRSRYASSYFSRDASCFLFFSFQPFNFSETLPFVFPLHKLPPLELLGSPHSCSYGTTSLVAVGSDGQSYITTRREKRPVAFCPILKLVLTASRRQVWFSCIP